MAKFGSSRKVGGEYNLSLSGEAIDIELVQKMLETIESHQGDKMDVFVDKLNVSFNPSILLL